MPIYEYRCDCCEHEFEVLQSISDDRLTDCPACKRSALRKKLSVAAFHLKGTGWYETDFKTKPKDKDGLKDKDSSKDSAKEKPSPSSSKSESKADSSDSAKKTTDKSQSAGANAAAG